MSREKVAGLELLIGLGEPELQRMTDNQLTRICWANSLPAGGGRKGMVPRLAQLAATLRPCRQCRAVAVLQERGKYLLHFRCSRDRAHKWAEPTDRFPEAKAAVLAELHKRSAAGVCEVELARATGLTAGTVGQVVEALSREGKVIGRPHVGLAERFKPRRQIRFDRRMRRIGPDGKPIERPKTDADKMAKSAEPAPEAARAPAARSAIAGQDPGGQAADKPRRRRSRPGRGAAAK